MKIGILVGSLRKGSFNKKLAEISKNIINEGNEAEIIDISYLPFYNQDDDGENPREEYTKIREELRKYDAYLFFTPEYNRSLAPALKNVGNGGMQQANYSSDDRLYGLLSTLVSKLDNTGDITIPVYLGNDLIDERIIRASDRRTVRSGGRA